MAELKIELKDSLVQELEARAKKREISLEDYVAKALRFHLKEIKKLEAKIENDSDDILRIMGQDEEADRFDPQSADS